MRIVLTSLLVATAVLGGMFFWLDYSPDQPVDVMPAAPAVTDYQPASEHEVPSEPIHGAEEPSSEKQFARRITSVPGDPAKEPEPGRPFDFEFQESAKKMVEASLAGQVEDAVNLGQLVNRCTGEHRSEAQILQSLQSPYRAFSPKTTHILSNGEVRRFQSREEYEAYTWEVYDQCRVIRTVFEDDLRERIIQLADNGHAIARYLYAMWRPPVTASRVNTDNLLEWLAYQDRALEYTLENVNEGEPLGLLGLALSYKNIRFIALYRGMQL